VIEVAESSLDRDRGLKLRAYARAGIPQYLVFNLKSRLAEIYEGPEPGTGALRLCHPGERLKLLLPSGERVEVGAAEILP
jgi:Uma2 family endonuclease